MVPNALVELTEMPLTVNGKIDRKALLAMDEREQRQRVKANGEKEQEANFEASRPCNIVEEILMGVWELVLKRENAGVEDDFFALGGHSLLATQVISRVQNALNLELPFRAIFEAPTIAGLAAEIEKRREGIKLETHAGYWRTLLAGAEMLELPRDSMPRGATSHRNGRVDFHWPNELEEKLKNLRQQEGVTLFMTLLAGFQALLHRYTGQSDILIATPLAYLNRGETEGLDGFAANTLPLRTEVKGELSFRELLRRVRRVMLDGYWHQDLLFGELIEEPQIGRMAHQMQLSKVLFSMNNLTAETMGVAGLPLQNSVAPEKFDLNVEWIELSGALKGWFRYRCDLFKESTIRRMAAHYGQILKSALANPEQEISQLNLLSSEESLQVLQEWNATEREYPNDKCIHELFEEQVERTPDAMAVIYEETGLTYAQLNQQANHLARHLRMLGVKPDVRVGISVERSLEMMVGIFGILKAGGIYVPLDPNYPPERLKYMIQDSAPAVLLTQARIEERLPRTHIRVLRLDTDVETFARYENENLRREEVGVTPDHLAYVIYTSGSTGKPKGAMNAHRAVINGLLWARDEYKLGCDDRILQKTPFSFDLSVWELLLPGLSGAQLVMARPGGHTDPQYLAKLIEDEGITTAYFVPSMLQAFLDYGEMEGIGRLRRVLSSGEALPYAVQRRFQESLPGVPLHNLYGPTEAAVHVASWVCQKEVHKGIVPIGRPIANIQIYILDADLQPVPQGVAGDIYIGGAGVGQGYWNRPELTAERFVPNPFNGAANARMYRTGDLGRWLDDGAIECLGRNDYQVKVRGFRIELGEIEQQLNELSGVEAVVVMAREDEPGVKQLVAYVVNKHYAALTTEEKKNPEIKSTLISRYREELSKRLPEYMVPAHFVLLNVLPLSPNGKVDRKSLPAPDQGDFQRAVYLAPEGKTETILAGIWAEVLKVDPVGRHDNFFELGGHSLLATQVASRVRMAFRVKLPVQALFETPTIEGAAAEIEKKQRAGERLEELPLIAVGKRESYPLSFAQQRLWFLDQLEPGRTIYNVPVELRVKGALNVEALEHSLGEIVKRHEVLRTRLIMLEGQGVQVVDEWPALAVTRHDLRALEPEEREKEAERIAKEEREKVVDLAQGPMIRVRLLEMGEQEHVLLVNMHHIVSDGWSVGILVREFRVLYEGYVKGEEARLEPLNIQYKDFAVWQREWLQGEVLERHLEYWRKQLTQVEVLELPTDYAPTKMPTHRGGQVGFRWPKELMAQLKKLSRQEGVTLFMTLLAGFQLLLHRYSGQRDIVVGTDVSNRNRAEIEDLIGFFVNQLVLRTKIPVELSFRQVLKRVRQVTLEAYEHQDLPFERLVEELQPERDLGHSPLFQVKLVMQNAPEEDLVIQGLEFEEFGGTIADAKFNLTLVVTEIGDGLLGLAGYTADLYKEATIKRMMGHLQAVMEEMLAHPERRISEFDYLSEAERHQVLEKCNRSEAAHVQEQCVHQLLDKQIARTPDAIAVVCGEQQLSYRELNRRANQLGHYLKKLGVAAEIRVGLCVERGLEMVIGMLGILKAGGCYVLMDPGYPTDRLSYIQENAQLSMLVTQGQLRARLPVGWAQVICMDEEWARIGEESEEETGTEVGGGNLACVVYGADSAGLPAGVAMPQMALAVQARQQENGYELRSYDRFLQLIPPSFDGLEQELFVPLTHGATVVIPDNVMSQLPIALPELIEREQITVLHCPMASPVELTRNELVSEGVLGRSVRLLITEGEGIYKETAGRWMARTARNLRSVYRPNEATIAVAIQDWSGMSDRAIHGNLTDEEECEERRALLGRPADHMLLYVLDDEKRPVGIGIQGELYVGGAGLARGYLGRAGLTAEKFVPNPCSQVGGERLYRTGDRVKWLENGELESLGRMDEQVNIRGYRIEMRGIEALLQQHVGVKEGVVVVRGDGEEKHLVGYVVLRQRGEMRGEELRRYLQEKLPKYMVPKAIVELAEMPLTVNGKIDRKVLLTVREQEEAQDDARPRTAIEEILIGIWEEVLKQKEIGVTDDFFALGGHSLLATQVILRIRMAFGLELPIQSLFETPTIKGLVAEIEKRQRSGEQLEEPPLVAVEKRENYPLSFAQRRLWFLDQLEPGNTAYNLSFGVRLKGKLNADALERSLGEIVRRHEVLRTQLEMVDGEGVQAVMDWSAIKMAKHDLRVLAPVERECEAGRIARHEAETPFDLGQAPMIRAQLLQMGEEEHVLLMTMHHIVSDGWSMGVLVYEFRALYEGFVRNEDPGLEEMKVQYKDFAVWQREWLQGEVLEKQLDYWRKQLAGMETLELPSDYERPAMASHRGGQIGFHWPKELVEKLKQLSRQEGMTLFMTLLAGFQVLLHRYSGQRDIVVGTDVSNRNRGQTEKLIGFFVNELVLRTEVTGELSFQEMLKQVRKVALGAYDHQDLPFEILVEDLQPERDLSRSPLFQVKMVMQNTPQETLQLEGLRLEPFDTAPGKAKLAEMFSFQDRPDEFLGTLAYQTDLFRRETMERMVEHLLIVMEEMAAHPERRITEFDYLSGAERKQVLEEWNPAKVAYRQDVCVHQLFTEQAEHMPGAVAVICQGQYLSYGELNRRANQLGAYLRELGVGPEVRVGLCMERSLEMVIGMLGVLKAGGAYIPLHASLPADRLTMMMEDSRPALLLTQSQLMKRLPSSEKQIVCIDENWPIIAEQPAGNVNIAVRCENLAYVIYTSGSTGRPKGVGIEHRQVTSYVNAIVDRIGFKKNWSYGLLSSFAADLGNTMLFPSLCIGGSLHVINEESGEDGLQLKKYLNECGGLDCLKIAPTHLHALMALAQEGVLPREKLVLGGEATTWEWLQDWQEKQPNCQMWNHYGPTECTVGVSVYDASTAVGNGMVKRNGNLSLGSALNHSQLYVLDEGMRPVTIGVSGELYIGGSGVGRGYWRRPELTAEKFVPNPYGESGGERMYRSGDRVRWRDSGELEFLGRMDNQVKIRGYRVELGEIESVLRQHAGVKQAAVLVHQENHGEERITAYIAMLDGNNVADLRRHLQRWLPNYMLPAEIFELPELPLLPNGKLDRKLLPHVGGKCNGEIIGPRDTIEVVLTQIWREILETGDIGIQDDFFQRGGHSLKAVKVCRRLTDIYQKNIPVRAIFEYPTIESLAAFLRKGEALRLNSPVVPIQTRGSNRPIFCVHPVSGLVHCYVPLGQHLGTNQPIYALQSIGIEEGQVPLTTVESMAALYISGLRTIQPEGPYQIVGYSMGVVVAYEMAVQLAASGQEISLLAMIDGGFSASSEEKDDDAQQGQQHGEHIALLDLAEDVGIPRTEMEALEPGEQLSRYLAKAKRDGIIPSDVSNQDFRRVLAVIAANRVARSLYHPKKFVGDVVLLRTKHLGGDPAYGFSTLARATEVIEVEGSHNKLLENPSVTRIAEILRLHMREVEIGAHAG